MARAPVGSRRVVTMYQTISGLIVGDQYQLTWDMESAYHCCASTVTPGEGAAIDGNLWQFIVPNSQGWQSYSETFTYAGVSSLLTFSAQRMARIRASIKPI